MGNYVAIIPCSECSFCKEIWIDCEPTGKGECYRFPPNIEGKHPVVSIGDGFCGEGQKD